MGRDMTVPLRRRSDIESTGLPPLRALVAEDDENYAAYIAVLLRRFGFDVTIAPNGTKAFAAAQERPVDVAVIDFEMPGMNGLELIAALRGNHRSADMYALMVTGHTDLETKVAALRLGYDDFITKSTGDTEMIAKLGAARRLVQRQRRLDAAVRELYGLATRDELTGLFNRRYFYAEAERMLAEGCKINLALFDLDDFKKVNDNHGHPPPPPEPPARQPRGLSPTRCRRATSGVASSTLIEEPTLPQLLAVCDRDLYRKKRAASSGQRAGEARAAVMP